MSTTLLLPRLGETMEQGRVVAWLKKPGESFLRGEIIVEIETDKTVVELPAMADGVLRSIVAEVGTDVDVGAPLGEFDPVGAEREVPPHKLDATPVSAPVAPAIAPAETKATAAPLVATRDQSTPLRATPNARRLARQHDIDLSSVIGTGRRARIQGDDVHAAIGGGTNNASGGALSMLDVPAGRIAFREWVGELHDEAPLVLLHGFAGDSSAWAVLANELRRTGRRVIAPDLPSHGATDFNQSDPGSMAATLQAFVESLHLPAIELVGHSLGGVVATRLAATLGSRVKRLTLLAPAGLGSEIDSDFIEGMACVAKGGGLAHLLKRIALNPPPLSAQQLDQMARVIHDRGALRALADAFISGGRQQVDISAELSSLKLDVRIVWGLDDQIIPWRHATQAGPGIPVFFLPHAGHMTQWDQPQKVAALFA